MAKSIQRIQARNLRKKGFGINEISRKIDISKRTVSRWCSTIKLTRQQEKILWQRSKTRYFENFKKYCEKRKEKTLIKIENLKKKGINEVGKISKKEFFLSGVALYWAEGFKKDHRLGFANSDPGMIKFFLKWLKNCGIEKESVRLRVGINITYKNRIKNIENYWAKITNIPIAQFNKTFYQKTIWKKEYENKDNYYGVLRIRVNKSTDFLRKIKGWIEGLKINTLPG